MSLLEVKNVSRKYKKKLVLEPLSFSGEKGECIVLCGGNGAGKSTLLSMIAGIITPSSGSVQVNGVTWRKNRKQYVKSIGYMPDDFHADQMMTVQEFLSFYASLQKVDRKRVEEVLSIIGLEDHTKKRIHHLSKGMRQRLLLGQALLAKPDVLVMDEPTNGLDPYWVNHFIHIIQEVKRDGSIVLFSTHMMDVAAETANRILFMMEGKVVEELSELEDKEEVVIKLLKLQRL